MPDGHACSFGTESPAGRLRVACERVGARCSSCVASKAWTKGEGVACEVRLAPTMSTTTKHESPSLKSVGKHERRMHISDVQTLACQVLWRIESTSTAHKTQQAGCSPGGSKERHNRMYQMKEQNTPLIGQLSGLAMICAEGLVRSRSSFLASPKQV